MNNANGDDERQQLMNDLLESVKQCQIRFGGRTELATELDSRVVTLCSSLENVFSHGLRKNKNLLNITKQAARKLPKSLSPSDGSNYLQEKDDSQLTFWHFVRYFLNKHERERYMVLKNVSTDLGRGRAWLRSALNENSLERYMLMILGDEWTLREQFYEHVAVLRDEEKTSMLTTISRGLNSILFAINIDNPDLNRMVEADKKSEPLPVIVATGVKSSHRRKKKSRRVPIINVVSFDEDDDGSDQLSGNSLPATSLSSPDSAKSSENKANALATDGGAENEEEKIVEALEATEFIESDVVLTPVAADALSVAVNENETLVVAEDDVSDVENTNTNTSATTNTVIEVPNEHKFLQLQLLLNEKMQENLKLRSEMEVTRKKTEEKITKLESQVETCINENQVLKNQLKKYISAVQLLQLDEQLLNQDEEELMAIPKNPSVSYLYYHEAVEYEKKLVQVAEMHGELVEFNDRLHRIIMQKDLTIKRLKDELIDLRGPLPEDIQGSDEDESNSIEGSCYGIPVIVHHPLVNIWIPTAFLAGQQKSSSAHHVYQVYVRIKDEEWNVYRRYSQFHALHKYLRKKFPAICSLDFPPKKTLGNKDAKVVQDRRKKLENYLRSVLNLIQVETNITDRNSLVKVLPFLGENKLRRSGDNRSRSDSQLNVASTSQASGPSMQHYIGL